ncbi:MAG: TolC family protein, partial [Cytophagales bacterium]
MRQFYRLLLFVVSWGAASSLYAQDQATNSFTLEQCIDYALKNSISAQNALIDQQIAAAKVKETVGLGLPQVSGSASLQHNEQLRRFFGRYTTAPGSFSFFPVTPGANDGDILAAQNFFQLKSSGDAGLNIDQLIFSGSYFVGLQASRTYKDLAVKTGVQTKEQIVEQVTKAYYNVLINEERQALFNNNIARIDSLLRNTKALNKNG